MSKVVVLQILNFSGVKDGLRLNPIAWAVVLRVRDCRYRLDEVRRN